MNHNADEIIKNLLKDKKNISGNFQNLSESDIKNRLETIDKNAAVEKLNRMGLGQVAEKLKTTSDKELIKIITENPALLKKINNILK